MFKLGLGKLGLGSVLRQLIPEDLFLPGLFLPKPIVVEIDGLSMDGRSAAKIGSLSKESSRPISLVLDPARTLVRQVTIPRAAGAHVASAIALQLRQTLPGQARGLTWRTGFSGHDGKQSNYLVYIVKDRQITELLTQAREVGGDVETITLAGLKVSPLWQSGKPKRTVRARWVAGAVIAVALASAWSVIKLERQVLAMRAANSVLAVEIDELQARLISDQDRANENETLRDVVAQDVALFNAQAVRLSYLADLTDRLPDTVWVSELSISGSKLVFAGFSAGDVAEVVSDTQSATWANSARLQGPIIFDNFSQQNRFELGLEIAAEIWP